MGNIPQTEPVRTVFAPSPIGRPSLGLIRTAVFNWALARHHAGRFVLRIEDTDLARVKSEYYDLLCEVLRWLGLDWDEGPEVGGPYQPYIQSERRELHLDVARTLLASGELYESFSSPEEIADRHRKNGRDANLGYDNADRDLTAHQKAAFRAEGRKPLLRLRMPSAETEFDDLIRGEIVFKAGSTADPVLVRSNGQPTFALANPVDDATMGITHTLRGENALPSMPRMLATYAALRRIGVARFTPRFGHLAMMLDAQGKALSSALPEADVLGYRDKGFLPEAVINYLASVGWSHPAGADVFAGAELVEHLDPRRIRPRPAKVDSKRMVAFNVAHLRALSAERFAEALLAHLPKATDQPALLARAAPLAQTRSKTLVEAAESIAFLFEPDDFLVAATDLDLDALRAAVDVLTGIDEWSVDVLAAKLKPGLGDRPAFTRAAFAALRLVVTGNPATPLLYESLALLGRDRGLTRLQLALGVREQSTVS